MQDAHSVVLSDFATFGDMLRYLRRRVQLTQRELAIACGYSPPHISHLESNQRLPDQATLLALFVPALGLEDEPELVERLLALAASARRDEASSASASPIPPRPRHNLPTPVTPFIGRADELGRIAELLGDPAYRLITLTGAGGIGKTRLALQAAQESLRLGRFPDGVFFVSLVGVSSSDFLVSAIAEALGFERQVHETHIAQLQNYLCTKCLLLVLDNFEHLLDGVYMLLQILERAPTVKLMVTSREPLNVQTETVFPVEGLETPDGDGSRPPQTYSAVQLFVQCARHTRATFSPADSLAAVSQICRYLEGLPLGIELAAGLLRILPIEEIAEQIEGHPDMLTTTLRDVPARHRSLRAVFEQSWSLLSDEERSALMKLTVFRGGFRREAADYVAGASFRVLFALLDKSLIRLAPSGRYEMHELLRQFAEEKLRAAPEAWETAQERHSFYYADFVYQRQGSLERDADRDAVEQIEADSANVRAAWDWAIAHGRIEDPDKSLRGLYAFYIIRGWFEEGLNTFRQAVEELRRQSLCEHGKLVIGRILARQATFEMEFRQKSWQEISSLLEQSLSIVQAHNAPWDIAFIYRWLGWCKHQAGQSGPAREALDKSLAIFRRIGDLVQVADCLRAMGDVAWEDGHPDEAMCHYQDELSAAREAGSVEQTASALGTLSVRLMNAGQYQEARQYRKESLLLRQKSGYRSRIALCLYQLAYIASQQGQYAEARELAQENLRICREIGSGRGEVDALCQMGTIESDLGNHSMAMAYFEEALSILEKMTLRGFTGAFIENNLAWEHWLAGSFEAAQRLARHSVATLRGNANRCGLASVLDTLGHATASLGQHQEAKQHFLEALKIMHETRLVSAATGSIIGIARLKAAGGESERALELLGLVLNHPAATGADIQRTSKPLLAQLEAELPLEVVTAGLERGKKLDLDTVVAELLQDDG